jgi:hypothetical protein
MHSSKQQRYSITSSARASTAGGIVRPSPFAVLRLITKLYLVGACTGRSADIKLRPLFRRYWVESGHHWLVMSISAFDP